jgi:hypothetical protein
MRDDLGMVHRTEYRAGEEDGNPGDDEWRQSPAPRDPEHDDSADGDEGSP